MQTGQVYTFKLNSGEEVIAKVTNVEDNYVSVETPVSVAPGPQGMGLIQSLFTADPDQKIQINMNCVAIHALTDDGVKMKYIEATTGIKVPDKKIIMV